MIDRRRSLVVLATAALVGACVGTTGGEVIDFPVAAAGPADASGTSLEFTTDRGWHVVLTKASVHIGALYLSQIEPVSGAQATGCVLPGTYVAQQTTGLEVDVLSATPQRFPTLAHGTTLEALTGQVWLSGGGSDHDLDQLADTTPVLVVAGTADHAGDVRPFQGQITIAANRQPQGGSLAGASTICKQRIVSPIPTRLTVSSTGGLLVRIDPRLLFVNVDFGQLGKVGDTYTFSDDPSQSDPSSPLYYSQPSVNLYANLHAAGAPGAQSLFTFGWEPHL
jgi:hypothetical protein